MKSTFTYHSITSPIRDHLDLFRPQQLIHAPLGQQTRSLVCILLRDVFLYEPRLVYWRPAVVENEDGELLEGIVLGRFCGAFPGNFALELEGDAFFEEGNAVLTSVWGRGGADEGEHFVHWEV